MPRSPTRQRPARHYCTTWRGGNKTPLGLKNRFRVWYGNRVIEVQSTKDQTFFVDFADLPRVRQLTWHSYWAPTAERFYFRASRCKDFHWNSSIIPLARWILNYRGSDMVDHIDGNPRNNCRSNLRIVTRRGNRHNTRLHSTNSTGYNGISIGAALPVWQITYTRQGKIAKKTFIRRENDDELPVRLVAWIEDLRKSGYSGNLLPRKYVQPSRYILAWRECKNKRCSRVFPSTPEGLKQAIAARDAIYERIGNTNGKRLA